MNVRGADSPKILGQRLRHVAATAGRLPHRHAPQVEPCCPEILAKERRRGPSGQKLGLVQFSQFGKFSHVISLDVDVEDVAQPLSKAILPSEKPSPAGMNYIAATWQPPLSDP